MKHSKKACELTSLKDDRALDALAMAYAESGDFNMSLQCIQNAVDLKPDANVSARSKMKERFTNRLPHRFQPREFESPVIDEDIPFDLP
jgi:hypothetical protein